MTTEDLRRISAVRVLVASGKVRERRENRRLTLREIADSVGASVSTVHRWEQGTAAPRSAAALRLADVLDITSSVA
ncbi:helix-turn-helix transcriptional regulator [Streptomyces sp. NPDC006372]|uniref:helix-turn-helix domain-containing protein n=1 Tax=Streptomyces sp. NPDC006372 TaxID=3155599 RepID=UPI0033BCE061